MFARFWIILGQAEIDLNTTTYLAYRVRPWEVNKIIERTQGLILNRENSGTKLGAYSDVSLKLVDTTPWLNILAPWTHEPKRTTTSDVAVSMDVYAIEQISS